MLTHQLQALTNGLPVLSIAMPSVQSVTVFVMANAGSRFETPPEEGLAHFFEHMVFKGTDKFANSQELSAMVDGIGAEFNAFTSQEYTCYYIKSASQHFSLVLDVLSDMLLTPKLRQADIDREKGVIIEEINMYADNPMRHVGNQFEELAFGGSRLGHDVAGSKESVSAITREHFAHFLSAWYGLENLLLVVAGDETVIKGEQFLSSIELAFSKNSGISRQAGKQSIPELQPEGYMGQGRLKLITRPTEQAHFVLGWPAFKRTDERKYQLSVLSTILGGTASSRLFNEVREKRGLCYYVHSETDFYHETGIFGASAGVETGRIEEALKVTLEQFQLIADGKAPITHEELIRAQEHIAGSMTLSFEDSQRVAQFYGMRHLLNNQVETLEDVLAKVRAVTIEEMVAVAQTIVRSGELRLAVIGPYQDEAVFQSIIQRV